MPTEKQCYVELEFSEFPASESQVSTICLEAFLFEWLFFLCIELVAKMFGSQLFAHILKAKELSTRANFGSFQAYFFFRTEQNVAQWCRLLQQLVQIIPGKTPNC